MVDRATIEQQHVGVEFSYSRAMEGCFAALLLRVAHCTSVDILRQAHTMVWGVG